MQLKLSLSVMTTFAYAFCTYGQEILNKSHIEIKDSWYCDHFKFNEKKEKERVNDPRWSENKGVIQNFVTYLNNFFLPWACALDESGQNISLINREKISESAPIIGKPLKLANYSKKKDHIGYFLKEKQKDGKDFDFFINQSLLKLDLTRQRTLSAGNKYINLFYEAALKFCKVNYNLQ